MTAKLGKQLFNDDWSFMLREASAIFPELDSDAPQWAAVEFPHDRLVRKKRDFYKPVDSWYKKSFEVTAKEAAALSEKRASFELTFDGISGQCSVYVNDTLALEDFDEPQAGFTLEIAPFLKEGTNTVHVKASHSVRDKSAEHTGVGIYRNVWLTRSSAAHICAEGGIIVKALIRDNAPHKIRVHVEYVEAPAIKVDMIRYSILSPDGAVIASSESARDFIFELNEAVMWEFNNPRLYTAKVQLIAGEKIVDEAGTHFPLRSLVFPDSLPETAALNGGVFKLRGVVFNSDSYGILGAAFNLGAARHRLYTLRELGVNAITAADSAFFAPEIAGICDEIGLLLLPHTPTRQSFIAYDALFDNANAPKPEFYRVKAMWAEGSEPWVKILPYWDWNVGQPVSVSVYSNMSKIELFFGSGGIGKSLGRKIVDTRGGEVALWELPYECGELTARVYNRDDAIAAVDRIASFWDASTLIAKATPAPCDGGGLLRANGRDLVYIDITAHDEAGEFVANANNCVSIQVSGAARLAGADNGDEFDYESYFAASRRLFGGRLTAILQTTLEPDENSANNKAFVQIYSRGLKEAAFELDIAPALPEEAAGVSVIADDALYYELDYSDDIGLDAVSEEIPARKVELVADRTVLTKTNRTAKIKAEIFPANSDYTNVEWLCEFDDEHDIDYEDVAHLLKIESIGIWCNITLVGELGELAPAFRIVAYCRGKNALSAGAGASQTVSEIEMRIEI
ncbi:MAG: DUF4982 domain-containing protein [Oscillospiraceae bacterium]|nr:DUF4982 domain-containing protein [Oscillospiraceae bacterium]